jgi:hypothetical protein
MKLGTILFIAGFIAFFVEVLEPSGKFVRNGTKRKRVSFVMQVAPSGNSCAVCSEPTAKKDKKTIPVFNEKSHAATVWVPQRSEPEMASDYLRFTYRWAPLDGYPLGIDHPPIFSRIS